MAYLPSERSLTFGNMKKPPCVTLTTILAALHFTVFGQISYTNQPSRQLASLATNVTADAATPVEVFLTGVAGFAPRKWAFITLRSGTQETRLTLKEGEEKAGVKLQAVNTETAEARVTIAGREQTISFGAPAPGVRREQFDKEERDREHARISALRAQQDRERDALELSRHLQQLRSVKNEVHEEK